MKKLSVFFAILAAGCAARPVSAPAPRYMGIARGSEQIASHIATARADSKQVKAAQLGSMSLLDRLDYKAVILLEK
jgi:hypothetical protein